MEEIAPRFFTIKTKTATIRRNRRHIRKLHSTTSTNNVQQQAIPRHDESHDELEHDTSCDTPDNQDTPEDETPSDEEEYYDPLDADSDSDASTIPYSDDDAAPPNEKTTTRSGRVVKERQPLDYNEI